MNNGYLDGARKQFRYYKLLGERTFEQLTDAELHWQYNAETNSVATIVKHLWGNMRSRWTDLLTSDGEKPWREREAEFDNDIPSRSDMLAKWEEGWGCLFRAIDPLDDADLGRIVYIRNEGHTVQEAINRQLAHYPYHVGQIVHIGKMLRGQEWKSLSIPRGGSKAFNADKFSKPMHRGHYTDDMIPKDHDLLRLREDLQTSHDALWHTVEALGPDHLDRSQPGKWSALQHLEHIHLGVRAMADYLALPKATIAEKFGRMQRPSMDLDTLSGKYYERLAMGVTPPERFMPQPAKAKDRSRMIEACRAALVDLLMALGTWTGQELDVYMCPHPAMGPLTAREMVMFTALHARHHTRSIERIAAAG